MSGVYGLFDARGNAAIQHVDFHVADSLLLLEIPAMGLPVLNEKFAPIKLLLVVGGCTTAHILFDRGVKNVRSAGRLPVLRIVIQENTGGFLVVDADLFPAVGFQRDLFQHDALRRFHHLGVDDQLPGRCADDNFVCILGGLLVGLATAAGICGDPLYGSPIFERRRTERSLGARKTLDDQEDVVIVNRLDADDIAFVHCFLKRRLENGSGGDLSGPLRRGNGHTLDPFEPGRHVEKARVRFCLGEIFQFHQTAVHLVFQADGKPVRLGDPGGHDILALNGDNPPVANEARNGFAAVHAGLVVDDHVLVRLERVVHQALHVVIGDLQVDSFGWHQQARLAYRAVHQNNQLAAALNHLHAVFVRQ